MTLDEAMREVESRFEAVTDYVPGECPTAVNGTNRYVAICSAGPKREGEPTKAFDDPRTAVIAWRDMMVSEHIRHGSPRRLFWRTRPEMQVGREHSKPSRYHVQGREIGPVKFYVYSRLTFA